MRHPSSPLPATLAALAFALGAPSAQAGGPPSGGSGCNCLPATHTVTIPGVTVVPPTTYIAPPYFSGVGGSSGSGVNVDVSVNNDINVSAAASGTTYAASTANAQAANLLAASGAVYVESGGGVSGTINNLTVVEQNAPAPQQCIAHAAVFKAIAIQAVCLDDKAVPHPASQLFPDRDVAAGYSGELFRCVAGSHMQYVTTAWTGAAQFDHGQTAVCQKGDALWRAADGHVQCSPQKPARDCNERSLLRRFGAGIKVVRAAADICTAYGPGGTVAAQSVVPGGDFNMDGGVGR